MSIASNTFTTTAGFNYVDNPVFAGIIYGVKRAGMALSKTTSAPTGNQYSILGTKIFVDPANPFNTDELLWVLYDGPAIPPPPACIPVAIVAIGTDVLPNAISGIAYSASVDLTGTTPFTLSSIVKPSWMTVAVSGTQVLLTGTPSGGDIGTSIPVSFTVNNCSSDTASYSATMSVLAGASNGTFTISNEVTFAINTVRNVFPGFFTISSGVFPVQNGQTISGFLTAAVSTAISVFVITNNPSNYLELYKNGVLVSSVLAPISGTYAFAVTSFLITDNMEIKYKIYPI